MSAQPVVEIDGQTREELQPPCDQPDHGAAHYIVRFVVTCECSAGIALLCDDCAAYAVDHLSDAWECVHCGSPSRIRAVEPLR